MPPEKAVRFGIVLEYINISGIDAEAALMAQGLLDPALLVTHIGGPDCAVDATLSMPSLPSGKKLIYTGIEMPLTAIDSFQELGKTSPLFARLHEIVSAHNGLWCAEAEKYLLEAKANENQ